VQGSYRHVISVLCSNTRDEAAKRGMWST